MTKVLKVEISNPQKIIYHNPKITKLDIVNYYKLVSRRMMPFLENRLISVIRCPSGNYKDKFFKKHLEASNQDLGQVILKNSKDIKKDYYFIKNPQGLIKEVQMNSFEFHLWGSQVTNLNNPNLMVFDLDPDSQVNLTRLRQGVKDLKMILDKLHLKSYLKTSGGKGYHVVVFFKNKMTWTKFRNTAKNIAILMEQTWPDKYTSNIRLKNRHNKIFIDWLRNTRGSTSVAPYSIRLRDKCRVSMPIAWHELDKIKPDDITISEALKRLKKKNPWQGFFH